MEFRKIPKDEFVARYAERKRRYNALKASEYSAYLKTIITKYGHGRQI